MTLDELVVELKLDPSNFTKGQKEALASFKKTDDELQKRLKNIEASTKSAGFGFSGMTGAAQGLFTVLAGAGMAAFARDTVNSAAASGRMATNIGIATRELSAFGLVIERNGGSAESAAASLKGYADTIQNWKWGKGSPDFLTGLTQIGGASFNASPLEIVEKLAKFAETHTAQQTNQTGARLGMSQDIINTAIHGLKRFREQYADASKVALGQGQVEKLTELQEAWVKLSQTFSYAAKSGLADISPALTGVANAVTDLVGKNQGIATTATEVVAASVAFGMLAKTAGLTLTILRAIGAFAVPAWLLKMLGLGGAARVVGAAPAAAAALVPKIIKGGGIGGAALSVAGVMKYDSQHDNKLRTWLRKKLGIADEGEAAPWAGPNDVNPGTQNMERRAWGYTDDNSPAPAPASEPPKGDGRDSPAVREARIRSFAKMLGIDPDVATKVARAEGFKKFSGDNGTSFGNFQLHVTPGGRDHAVGDEFKRKTGLDPSDPRNEAMADLFALQDIAKNGWRAYHGAARVGVGDREGIGKTEVNVASINIYTPSKDPADHGRRARNELEKIIATNANTGQRP